MIRKILVFTLFLSLAVYFQAFSAALKYRILVVENKTDLEKEKQGSEIVISLKELRRLSNLDSDILPIERMTLNKTEDKRYIKKHFGVNNDDLPFVALYKPNTNTENVEKITPDLIVLGIMHASPQEAPERIFTELRQITANPEIVTSLPSQLKTSNSLEINSTITSSLNEPLTKSDKQNLSDLTIKATIFPQIHGNGFYASSRGDYANFNTTEILKNIQEKLSATGIFEVVYDYPAQYYITFEFSGNASEVFCRLIINDQHYRIFEDTKKTSMPAFAIFADYSKLATKRAKNLANDFIPEIVDKIKNAKW